MPGWGAGRNGEERERERRGTHLERRKSNVREAAVGGGGRVLEDMHEAKLVEVSPEGGGVFGKDEGVACEEPLERDEGERHEVEEEQVEGVLAAGEARVEEAKAGDHEPDEGGAAHDPGEIADAVCGDAGGGGVGVGGVRDDEVGALGGQQVRAIDAPVRGDEHAVADGGEEARGSGSGGGSRGGGRT